MRERGADGGGARAGLAVGLLALLAALVPAPARAAREHRPAPADAVRWLEPAPERTLVAGEPATFAWEPGRHFERLGAVEEWELFVSYDGGASWPVRLTPHLDARLRRWSVRLPAPASDDVRLLMRIGDERIEHEVELPGRRRIAPRRAGTFDSTDAVSGIGRSPESARGSGAPVRLWAEGGRDGRNASWRAAPAGDEGWGSSRLHAVAGSPFAVPTREAASPAPARTRRVEVPHAVESRPRAPAAAPVSSLAPLERTCRRNE
jgi:hypothetical protein